MTNLSARPVTKRGTACLALKPAKRDDSTALRSKARPLRVLVIGPRFPDSFARNIFVTLGAMGHDVTSVEGTRVHHQGGRLRNLWWNYAPKAFPVLESVLHRELVETARSVQPNLVLVTYGFMPPHVVENLKTVCSGKVVCWYTDPITNLHRHYLLASPYDAIFVKEPFLARILTEKLGRNAYYLPECCNPLWHRRVSLSLEERVKYGCDLAAQGTMHYYRAGMLEPFAGYDLKIWGRSRPVWLNSPAVIRYTNYFVAEGEKARALGAAKVVINTMHYSEIEGVNCTLFEVAGCGTFQIADCKPTLPDLFKPEREVVTFRTHHELKEKVDYYLAHPEERQEIADRAYARAHREHTYEARLRTMLRILGLDTSPAVDSEVVTLQAE